MTFDDKTTAELNKPLDPKHVVKPSGSFGPKGDYLEGWHVINELNRVFGFGGWSYTIDLSRDALEKVEGKEQWQAAYTCVCTLTVGDVVRQDVGFGSGFAKMVGDAIEGATKEAATDALKRCARTFGNVFGLALYDKSRANVRAGEPAKITEQQVTALIGELQARSIVPGELISAANENLGTNINNLTELPAASFADAMSWVRSYQKAA